MTVLLPLIFHKIARLWSVRLDHNHADRVFRLKIYGKYQALLGRTRTIRFIPLAPRIDSFLGLLKIAVQREATALQDIVQIRPVEPVERDFRQRRTWWRRNQSYETVNRVRRPLVRLHLHDWAARDVTWGVAVTGSLALTLSGFGNFVPFLILKPQKSTWLVAIYVLSWRIVRLLALRI